MKIRTISLLFILGLMYNSVLAQKIKKIDPNKPSSVILILANGMGSSALSAAMMESDTPMNLLRLNYSGLVKSSFVNNLIPDEAAIMTALSCGVQTNNGILGIDKNGIPVENLFEIARKNKRFTGFITTAAVTDVIPAAFYAHQSKPSFTGLMARDLIRSDVNVFIGGGRKIFKDRDDKKSLMNQLNINDFKILEDYKELKGKSGKKIAGLLDEEHIKAAKDGRGDFYNLAWLRAFKTLIRNDTGFFMVIDNSHIGWACQANDEKYLVSEILDLDKILGEIMNIVSPDNRTLVIVVSCYEIGGLSVTQSILDKKINYKWSNKQHTNNLTPIFAYGPGADNFTGILDLTEIFVKLKNLIE